VKSSAASTPSLATALVVALGLWLFSTGCEDSNGDPPGATDAPSADHREDPATSQPARLACRDRSKTRNAYFGELHVHTALSLDAYTFETVGNADDAYRFARGEEIVFAGDRRVQLERPLDFTAITDHASTMGELRLCTDPESPVYDHRICRILRNTDPVQDGETFEASESGMNVVTGGGVGVPLRNAELCGEDFELCKIAMDSVWADHQRAAERFLDRSENCRFTTFNGYEYTATPDFAKVHRNVIFRNEVVPSRSRVLGRRTESMGPVEKARRGMHRSWNGL